MITAKLKPRPVITLIINDSVGNIELPEFAEDNYCYLSLEKDGTLTLHEDRPFVSGNGEWSNQCGVEYEIVGQYDGDVDIEDIEEFKANWIDIKKRIQ